MTEQQLTSTEEKEERELEDAEQAFEDKNKIIAAQQSGEETKVISNPKDLPYTAKENQQILIALGFTPHYHDKDKEGNDETNFGIRVMNTKIGVKFNDKNPTGKVWAYELTEDSKKNFYKNGDLNRIPLIQKYRTIQEGKEPIPEITVTGKIVERRGGAIIIAITENGEKKECSFGLGAVKKDNDGAFIPAGFSKATEKNPEQKMDIPRDIRLPDYEAQLAQVPVADTTKEKAELPKKPDDLTKTDLQKPTEHATMDNIIKPEDPKGPTEFTEIIAKYVNILAEVTEAIFAEDRIPGREKGYGVKFVFDEVVGETRKTELSESTIEAIAKAILNAKISEEENRGGDHEEQA